MTHHSFYNEIFFYALFCFVVFYFLFEGKLQEQGEDMRGPGDEWDWGTSSETHKESIQSEIEREKESIEREKQKPDCWPSLPRVGVSQAFHRTAS